MERDLDRVTKLARVLDHYLVDPILGFVAPGAGDVAGSLLGLYAVAIAIRRRMSPVIVARMLLNLTIDAVLGIVPLIGDAFDIAFRANQRNVKLLAARAETGGRASVRDWLLVMGAALLFIGAIALTLWAATMLVRAIVHRL